MKKRKSPRHTFRYKLLESAKTINHKCPTLRGTQRVSLTLTADHVRESIRLRGVGNTQTCSMAICTKKHANAFPHEVEGTVDWLYSRAFVVAKVNKQTGLPAVCYEYEHNDSIARLNDTKGGQEKLLKELEAEGDRVIHLLPAPKIKKPPGKSEGRRDGSRSGKPITGARLRHAMAQLGGVASTT